MTRATVPATLPARPAYHVITDTLHRRLRRAEERELTAGTEAEREAATAEVVAIWDAIEAHEAEGRELDAEAAFERDHGGER